MQRISRRKFLGAAAATTAVFNFFPAHVLGLGGAKSPNEKLNIAGIGVAGQGGSDLSQFTSENIVALCDVDEKHAAETRRGRSNVIRTRSSTRITARCSKRRRTSTR